MSRLKRSRVISKSGSYNNSCSHASAAEKVFGIAELREKILMYAIHDSEVKISGETVKNVRLVQTSWLQTTNKLLQKISEPVIELTVDGNGFLEDAKKKAKRKMLNQFLETFGTPPRLQDSFLPVKLDLKLDFFRERNYQSLSNCLTRLGNDLVELQLEYPSDGGTMPGIFPSFSLPHLRKLSFQFSDEELEVGVDDDNEDVFGDNRNGLGLLQLILNACKDMRNLILPITNTHEGVPVPVDFKYIQLPATISFLDMRLKLTSKDLQVLLKNQLPTLSHLVLQLHDIPFEDELLFKILERFKKTLQILQIDGLPTNGHPRLSTLFRFPLMEKLKTIDIYSPECELSPGIVSDLQKCLPQLTVVSLMNQTEARLAKWTRNSLFEKVEKLTVSIVNQELEDDDKDYYISLGSAIITQLKQTFPNVSYLSLAVNISDLSSLKFVFQNMVPVKCLKITVCGNGTDLQNSSDLIDSTLLGLPLRLVVALKEDMEVLQTEAMIIKGGIQPSIRNLLELTSLSLDTFTVADNDFEENGMSLISDLLFRHAFTKMTELQELLLCKKFKPSLEMETQWKGLGRYMKYSNA